MSMERLPVPSISHSRTAGRLAHACVGIALAVGMALVVSGCSTASRQTAARIPAAAAGVEVVNRTPYAWKLTFRRDGAPGRVVAVTAGRTVSVEILPGNYRIEQRVDGAPASPQLSQVFDERFDAGQRYRWPLLTLLSETTSPVRP